jgi:hypothetical protein
VSLVFTEQPLDVQHRLNYTSFTGSFRNGRRPLFLDACRPLMRYLNRALVAMLLALVLAAIKFSPARVLCVYGLPLCGGALGRCRQRFLFSTSVRAASLGMNAHDYLAAECAMSKIKSLMAVQMHDNVSLYQTGHLEAQQPPLSK